MTQRQSAREGGAPEPDAGRPAGAGLPAPIDPLERELRRMAVLHRRDVMAVRRGQSRRVRTVPGLG